MKKHFNEELVITKKDNEDFENSTKWWICDNGYVDGDVRVRCHCHITGKDRCSTHRNLISKLSYITKFLSYFNA